MSTENTVLPSLESDFSVSDSIISYPTDGFTPGRGNWDSFDRYLRQLADVTGDGRADIVGFGENAVFVAPANADGTFGDSIISSPTDGFTPGRGNWDSFDRYPRQLADVTGDGRADIVGFGETAVFVAAANADGTFGDSIISSPTDGFTPGRGNWDSFDRYPRQLADVTGDGRADIVGFGENAVFVAPANADGTFGDSIISSPTDGFTPGRGNWDSFDRYLRQLADVTGDGRADIVGFGENAVFVAPANADGTFGDSIISSPTDGFTPGRGNWDSFGRYPRQLADVTGDGRADIVGFGENAVFVAPANADGTFGDSIISSPTDGFTPGRGNWDSFGRYPRQLADVTGDGRADIIGFGENAVFVAAASADGTFGGSVIF